MFVSATIVLCLGLGIGATGTAFAWMESVVFQPLPAVAGLSQLVSLKMTTATDDDENLSYPDYKDTRDAEARSSTRTFVDLAAFDIRRFMLRTDAAAEARLAEPLWGALASANYFDVLGVRSVAGRAFLAGEDAVARGTPVVVISHALWQRRFGGDRDVIGRGIWLNGRAMTIVGVAPPGFYGTIARLALDLWMPVTMQPEVAGNPYLLDERETRWLSVFGRLTPGTTLASARSFAQATGARMAATFPEDRDLGLTARTLDIGPVDRLAPLFTVMLGIAGLVLLIVCSNVANLLLQRPKAVLYLCDGLADALGNAIDRVVRLGRMLDSGQVIERALAALACSVSIFNSFSSVVRRIFRAPTTPCRSFVNSSNARNDTAGGRYPP